MTNNQRSFGKLAAQVEAMALAKRQKDKSRAANSNSTRALQLPLWPEQTRGVPNGVLRSALFGVFKKGAREYMDRVRIEALEGIEIYYTGQRLDQGDLDLWENILHLYRERNAGEMCRFRAVTMLRLLGKTDTGKNRDLLHTRLLRLKANGIEVKQRSFSYIGSLIDEAYKDDISQEYVVALNSKLQPFFDDDQFTQLHWEVRKSLDGKPLAQWLHGFYSTHAQPFQIKVDTLRKLCGSNTNPARLDHFQHDLCKALDAVVEASVIHGKSFRYVINKGLLSVVKSPSNTQQRHLVRKAIKS